MTLIDCPGCGEEVSDTDAACPHCGLALEGVKARPARGGVPAWVWWVGGIVVVLPGLLFAVGLVASIVLPAVASRLMPGAQLGKALADVAVIDDALDHYAIEHGGAYPDSLDELVEPDENGFTFLRSPDDLIDPWGTPYGYFPFATGERRPRVVCYGADGKPGGVGDDMDFDNLMIERGEK